MNIRRFFDTPKKIILWLLTLTAFAVLYFLIFDYLAPSTSDAYLDAYTIEIAPQVAGRITEVFVKDNQHVQKGDVLFHIERDTYLYEYLKEKANLEKVKDQIKVYKLAIEQADFKLATRKENFKVSEILYKEGKILYKKEVISYNKYLEKQDKMIEAREALLTAEKELLKAKADLGPELEGMNIHLLEAQARLDDAEYNLGQTIVKAPCDGYITHLRVQKGFYAHTGDIQMALVKEDDWWVTVNIKENDLARVSPRQKALVSFYMYPGKIFEASVESIGWGVNLEDKRPSNYLPYIEKTMNWVKLAQRFPVRVRLKHPPKGFTFRIGSSAVATVYTVENPLLRAFPYFYQWLRAQWQYFS